MKRTVELFLSPGADYSILMIEAGPRGRVVKKITATEARELWDKGAVKDYNLAFKRLAMQFNFDVDAVRAYIEQTDGKP
jgi:hypothetical protein